MSSVIEQQIQAIKHIRNSQRDLYMQEMGTVKHSEPKENLCSGLASNVAYDGIDYDGSPDLNQHSLSNVGIFISRHLILYLSLRINIISVYITILL